MATKKPSPRKSTKKPAAKKTNKKVKAAENTIVEETKAPLTISETENKVYVIEQTEQTQQPIPSETTSAPSVETSISPTPTSTEETTEQPPVQTIPDNNKNETVVENVSYNNMVVPNTIDKTYLYVIGALGALVIITLLLL